MGEKPIIPTGRLLSLDVMRGVIMILLAAESCRLYESLHHLTEGGVAHGIVQQFFHHPWNGLRFWDLVQPAFMTMAGTALYISFVRREAKGVSWRENFRHVGIRCFRLLVAGVALYCIAAGHLVWELWNVLCQLAVTTIIAYLIIRRSFAFQLAVSLLLLLVTEMAYRIILVPGYDQPFTAHHNFGTYMDMVLMGKANRDGWVAINFIPTAAHTIWGCLIGKLLLSDLAPAQKIKRLVITGIIGLIAGYGLDILAVTPIIKRIATSSFVLASGGWVLLIMAFIYWLVDLKQINRYAWVPVVVGMNAIFIYVVFETVGYQWLNKTVLLFVNGGTDWFIGNEEVLLLLSSVVTLFVYWAICYWLYRRKLFFKI